LRLIGFALAMAASTFLVRLARPPTILNLHLGDFPQYIFLFTAGILAARGGWLPRLRFSSGIRWLLLTLPIGFVAWLVILVAGGALRGNSDAYFGGWHWQNAAICLWESLTCVAVCFGLIVLFREKFNSQGPLAKLLSENAFAVYVFHPPIVIFAARLLHHILWHPLLKFLILTAIGVVGSFALSMAVLRRIPLLRAIL
jgi:hypothetical protein